MAHDTVRTWTRPRYCFRVVGLFVSAWRSCHGALRGACSCDQQQVRLEVARCLCLPSVGLACLACTGVVHPCCSTLNGMVGDVLLFTVVCVYVCPFCGWDCLRRDIILACPMEELPGVVSRLRLHSIEQVHEVCAIAVQLAQSTPRTFRADLYVQVDPCLMMLLLGVCGGWCQMGGRQPLLSCCTHSLLFVSLVCVGARRAETKRATRQSRQHCWCSGWRRACAWSHTHGS